MVICISGVETSLIYEHRLWLYVLKKDYF